jgi:GT2 family glycosyltransferase
MKVSIVIVNFKSWNKLRICLESLKLLRGTFSGWEVIVVDNQSDDGQLTLFINNFPEFSFVENAGNYGFSNGCNLGARQSSGEYILFLNPDTKIALEPLKRLLQTAEEHPEFTVLSCGQVNDSGKDTRPYGLFISPNTLTSFMRSIHTLLHGDFATTVLRSGDEVIFPEWVSGSVVLMSRKNFDLLSGWCEDFWMYYEDADLCKRVWVSGGQVALVKTIQFIHNHGGASRLNLEVKALTKCEVITSRHLYIHKHFNGPERFLMQSYLVANNLLFGQLVFAILGLVLFFIPALKAFPKLYVKMLRYYAGVASTGVWISPRSVKFKKARDAHYENAKAKLPD